MSQINDRTKPRPRENSTSKPKPSIKTINLFIINGPNRVDLYAESQYCLDGNSGPTFRTKFSVRENSYTNNTISACVLSIEHRPDAAYHFNLRGNVHLCFTSTKKSGVYPFTATYDAKHHMGTIRIKIPLTDLPTTSKASGQAP